MVSTKKRTKSGSKNGNKSDAIREILKKQPKASVKEVQGALHGRGVKASDALINRLKYRRGTNGTAKKSPQRGKGRAKVNKAEAIRGAWRELGTDARPRDVIALLASRGITVTSAQVSTLRKSVAAKGKSAQAGATRSVPFEHLIAAKELAARVGGIENARQALASLSKLLGA